MNPPSVVTFRMSPAGPADGAGVEALAAGDGTPELAGPLGPGGSLVAVGPAADPHATRKTEAATSPTRRTERTVIGTPNALDRRRAPRLAGQTSAADGWFRWTRLRLGHGRADGAGRAGGVQSVGRNATQQEPA